MGKLLSHGVCINDTVEASVLILRKFAITTVATPMLHTIRGFIPIKSMVMDQSLGISVGIAILFVFSPTERTREVEFNITNGIDVDLVGNPAHFD